MKVLFCALHFGYYRNFESVITMLAERGHQVHLSADEPEAMGGQELVERLSATYAGVTFGFAPTLDGQPWFRLARKLRMSSDYVRFHDDPFVGFSKIRLTIRDRLPRGVIRMMDGGLSRSRAGRALRSVLRSAEELMPVSDASRAFIETQQPDVVLVASVTAWRSPQLDHLRAARALGIRTGICVFSWDHLSGKALLRVVPDRILLWNDTQRREAIDWHHMPAERVVVTGAQCYDQWFGRGPTRPREEFCRAVGLSPDKPFLLYVCSVMTPDPRESTFVRRWIAEIRRSPDPRLRCAGILVRPHPERMDEWADASFDGLENVALYGRNPTSPDAQADYFDSLYHSHAVVGIVTSAFLEAAVVGRATLTPLLPEWEMYQEGVQHFRYLLEVQGGLLSATRTLPDHLAELASALARPVARDERNIRFLEAFVRPRGLDSPATPVFVEALEALAAAPALPPAQEGRWHQWAQPLVQHIASSALEGWMRPVLRDTQELQSDIVQAEKAAQRRAMSEDRDRRVADKQHLLTRRRRERRLQQFMHARRKGFLRLKGRMKALVGLSS